MEFKRYLAVSGHWHSNPINCQFECWCMITLCMDLKPGNRVCSNFILIVLWTSNLLEFSWVEFDLRCHLLPHFKQLSAFNSVLLQIFFGRLQFHRTFHMPHRCKSKIILAALPLLYDSGCWFLTMTMKVFDWTGHADKLKNAGPPTCKSNWAWQSSSKIQSKGASSHRYAFHFCFYTFI